MRFICYCCDTRASGGWREIDTKLICAVCASQISIIKSWTLHENETDLVECQKRLIAEGRK